MSIIAHRGEILHCLADPLYHNDDAWQYFEDGVLLVDQGMVIDCGASSDLLSKVPDSIQVVNHRNSLITPGMVDTHIHYPQCEIIASYGTQLIDWLETYTFPAELSFGDAAQASRIAKFFLEELLRNGTTTALVFGTVHAESVDAFFTEALSRNLRMICGKVLMDRNAPSELCDTAESGFEDSRDLIDRWHGRGRLDYAITPRFAPTSSAEQLDLAGKLLSKNPGVYLHTHLSENTQECAWVRELFPDSQDYLDVYDRYGLLGRRSVFAHGIHLSEREWNRLSETESNISFCPTSNLFIGSGLFNLKKADKHGVRVGLGTDVGGGDSFSILRTINEAYKVQQLNGLNLSPVRSFYLATLGGAQALDLQAKIGNFERGKEADFLVLDYAATPLLKLRTDMSKDILEKLFVLEMLGDDRAIKETWIMGEKTYSRA